MSWTRTALRVGLACAAITPATLPLLYARSAMHGFSLGAVALPPTWMGARLPMEERSTAQAVLAAVMMFGIAVGPVLGSAMALALPLHALLFGLHHQSLAALLPLSALGLLWGWMYLRSGNLLAIMLIHALWNTRIFIGSLVEIVS